MMRTNRGVIFFCIAIICALSLGFGMTFFMTITSFNALIVTFLPVAILFTWVSVHPRTAPPLQPDRPLIDRIGGAVVLSSVLGFFLGIGIIAGNDRAEKAYFGGLTGTHLLLMFFALFIAILLFALVETRAR